MERKQSERVAVDLNGVLVSGAINCSVSVVNISRNGLCIKTHPLGLSIDFTQGTIYNVWVQFPAGDTVGLSGRIKWSNKNPVNEKIFLIGMEILEAPQEFTDFYDNMKEQAFKDYIRKSLEASSNPNSAFKKD